MSANKTEGNETESKRKQKNLRLHERYHDQLEALAVELFGSSQKQGQVVERLLDLHGDDDVVGMIEEMHSVIVSDRTAHTQVHSPSSSESDSASSEKEKVVAELERKAVEGEPIDPEDYDLGFIKGGKGVDRAAIVAQAVLTTHTGLDKASIKEFCQREVGYSPNGARELAKEVVWELLDELYTPIPSGDWVKEQVEQDIDIGYHTATVGNDSEGMSAAKYRREMSGSLEAYMGVMGKTELETGPFADESEAADAVYELMRVVAHQQDNGAPGYPRRSREVLREVWSRVQDEGLTNAKSPDAEQSLILTLSNMNLTGVVNGDSDA